MSDPDPSGKTAVVAGASSGIGRTVAERLGELVGRPDEDLPPPSQLRRAGVPAAWGQGRRPAAEPPELQDRTGRGAA